MILCVRRVPEEGTPVAKHVGAMLLVNFVVLNAFVSILKTGVLFE